MIHPESLVQVYQSVIAHNPGAQKLLDRDGFIGVRYDDDSPVESIVIVSEFYDLYDTHNMIAESFKREYLQSDDSATYTQLHDKPAMIVQYNGVENDITHQIAIFSKDHDSVLAYGHYAVA